MRAPDAQLTLALRGQAFRGTLLLSHLHWDHTHGMPFFRSGTFLATGSTCTFLSKEWTRRNCFGTGDLAAAFPDPAQATSAMAGPSTPLKPGHYEFEGFSVDALEIPHKGGRTFGLQGCDGSGHAGLPPRSQPHLPRPGPDGTGVYHDAGITLTETRLLSARIPQSLQLHSAGSRSSVMAAS